MKQKFKKKARALLTVVYVLLSLFTVLGEYEKDVALIKQTKPFLIPTLAVLYFFSTKKINWVYLLALFCIWMANVFFIFQSQEFIFKGSVSHLFFLVFITFLILVNTSFPGKISFLIAAVPFSFIYYCVFQLIYENIEKGVYLFFLNGALMIFLGAYSLANYFLDSNKPNTYLLISILFFTFIQFLVSIDLYYVTTIFFRPIAILLFVSAQFLLLKTMISYEIMNPYDKITERL